MTTPRKRTNIRAPMKLWDANTLREEAERITGAIARRAYELYQARGNEEGHDQEDWFRAESELLRPVSVALSEANDRLVLHANTLGFEPHELRLAVEPHRVLILGKKEPTVTETEGGKVEYIDWFPDTILRVVKFDAAVDPQRARVELQGGLLKFDLPKTGVRRRRHAA
jgi:HSP20 family molecular chaperone IbpA